MKQNPFTTVACYVRVSTIGQNEAGQHAEVQRWLDAHNLAERAVWYVDKASGKTLDRPAFDRLQRDIFPGKVGTVVCYKLDRLSRSLRDGINVLTDWCNKGIRVVAVSQAIDFSGAVGRLMSAVLLGVSEMEMETRRERQAAGIAVAKAEGKYPGRRVGTTKAKPARAGELRAKGLTDSEIAEALGTSRRTVQRYLRVGRG